MKTLCSILTATILCGGYGTARAAVVTYNFTATVDSFADAQGVFPGGFGLGTALTGTFSWDTDSGLVGSFGDVSIYQDPANNAAAISVSGGGISIVDAGNASTGNRNFVVTDADPMFGGDRFDRTADLNLVTFGGFSGNPDFSMSEGFSISLAAKSGENPFASTAIPDALNEMQFDLAGASFMDFLARNGSGQVSRFSADVTSFTAIPEPAATGMIFASLACGVALLRVFRRRSQPDKS